MGTLFTLTPAIKAVTQQALDDLITELGKNCLLIYPPRPIDCGCSGNVWLTGGPAPSDEFFCQNCGGTGTKMEQITETIKMSVITDPAHFYKKFPSNVQVPAGMIQTKCYLTYLPKLKQVQEIQVQPELDSVVRWRYKLDGEPIDVSSIIQGRYVVALWTRI